jgi:hypothetical protein
MADLSKEEKESLVKILDYLELPFKENETLVDFSKLTQNDTEDLFKRKLVADLVIAKKMGLLGKFLNAFNYK